MGNESREELGASGRRQLERLVELALAEDLGEKGDITSQAIFTPRDRDAARLIARDACTVSGLDAGREVCRQVDSSLTWLPLVEDGRQMPAGAEMARIEGATVSILKAERTVINFIAHLSGVATLTRRFVMLLEGLPARIAATRKTLPGLRLLEKQAVRDGGGESHRLGLYDAVLIKDNHIIAAGSVAAAVKAARDSLGADVDIEVEADTVSELEDAIRAGANTVLLDNMRPALVRECVQIAGGRVVIEASGGIDPGNVRAYAEAGADVISIGILTHSAPAIDISLEMEKLVL
ncbi:MAG: carboxylating nicotinate-nucleotide diphosphorylase [Thermoleophilia bacterium]|nr:carboxylating nicotinate-nucleotide diphosphorylase [Thermoleophilia bacterium]